MVGGATRCYCFYCKSQGMWNGHNYCAFNPPNNIPPKDYARMQQKKQNIYRYKVNSRHLENRSDKQHRAELNELQETGDLEGAKKQGIKRVPVLARLRSIDLPRSFPIDAMHLFYENVIPNLFNHFRGRFFWRIGGIVPGEGPAAEDTDEDPTKNAKAKKKNKQPKKDRKEQKFEKTKDNYCLDPSDWYRIVEEMAASNAAFPVAFGNHIRNITKHCHHFKAAEWVVWTHLLSPIYLRPHLPAPIYQAYVHLVEAVSIACNISHTGIEREKVCTPTLALLSINDSFFMAKISGNESRFNLQSSNFLKSMKGNFTSTNSKNYVQ